MRPALSSPAPSHSAIAGLITRPPSAEPLDATERASAGGADELNRDCAAEGRGSKCIKGFTSSSCSPCLPLHTSSLSSIITAIEVSPRNMRSRDLSLPSGRMPDTSSLDMIRSPKKRRVGSITRATASAYLRVPAVYMVIWQNDPACCKNASRKGLFFITRCLTAARSSSSMGRWKTAVSTPIERASSESPISSLVAAVREGVGPSTCIACSRVWSRSSTRASFFRLLRAVFLVSLMDEVSSCDNWSTLPSRSFTEEWLVTAMALGSGSIFIPQDAHMELKSEGCLHSLILNACFGALERRGTPRTQIRTRPLD
mmetsp:Transcript_34455/g.75950  ORF Transcript_34455/g.75950 Transcript_34455/m.75950 type:complete len:314 (-) Transcript_34455:19-960(-)